MNNIMKVVCIFLAVLSVSACSYVFGRSVEVQVVDDKNEPIEDARVKMIFRKTYESDIFTKKTSSDGKVSIRGSDHHGTKIIVSKPGFYSTQKMESSGESVFAKMLLREIKSPVPMYVKEVWARFPEKGKKFGFDLRKADWVAPYGSGNEAHVYFELNGYRKSSHDLEAHLVVTFPNSESGIMKVSDIGKGSVFKFPYDAPEKGYDQTVEHRYSYSPRENTYPKRESTREYLPFGYIFKIVDKKSVDEKRANFGKILGEFGFSVGKGDDGSVGGITFTYYYNPQAGSRSLEFDSRRNLFKDAEKTYPP